MSETATNIDYRRSVPARTRGHRMTTLTLLRTFDDLDYDMMVYFADKFSEIGFMTRALSSEVMIRMARQVGLLQGGRDGDICTAYRRLVRIRNKICKSCKKPPSGSQLDRAIWTYVRKWRIL